MTQPIAAPPAPKPPLTAREKAGARLAGILGFLILSLGWALFGIPLAVLTLGAFLVVLFGTIQRASGDDGPIGMLEGLDIGAWLLPLILCSVVGLLVIVASLFVSRGILRSHGLNKPWPITLAGAGVAVVASWVISAVLTVPFQLAGTFSGDDPTTPAVIALGVVALVVTIVSTAVIGWLSWWWMAHVLRPAVRTA